MKNRRPEGRVVECPLAYELNTSEAISDVRTIFPFLVFLDEKLQGVTKKGRRL